MRRFVVKTVIVVLVFGIILEIFSRVVLDRIYFASIDTYNSKVEGLNKIFGADKTSKVNYLFIGSSRVPAAIHDNRFRKDDEKPITVVAGRGYMTPGIHYQALKKRVHDCPDYLRNAWVFIEYPGSCVYTGSFEEDQLMVYESDLKLKESMAHLILPHLDVNSFIEFIKYSKNSRPVKTDLAMLYLLSGYRTSYFINEKWSRLEKPLFRKPNETDLAQEGGIRVDRIENARNEASELAMIRAGQIEKEPPLTYDMLEKSILNRMAELIHKSGGKVVLFKMPLHSVQQAIYSTEKSRADQQVFESWLNVKQIPVVEARNFTCRDEDFPDTWHLSKSRRDEFTQCLYQAFLEIQNPPGVFAGEITTAETQRGI